MDRKYIRYKFNPKDNPEYSKIYDYDLSQDEWPGELICCNSNSFEYVTDLDVSDTEFFEKIAEYTSKQISLYYNRMNNMKKAAYDAHNYFQEMNKSCSNCKGADNPCACKVEGVSCERWEPAE